MSKCFKNTILIIMIFLLSFLAIPSCCFATSLAISQGTSSETTNSQSTSDELKTNSSSNILMDAKTGKILYDKNADEKLYPASTTKLMTAILVLENCKLTDVATVSHNAVYSIPAGYSHASLKEGEELTIDQLLHVLLIPSANDAAVVLAEHVSGSVKDFATLMNSKAKELGCENTHFVNPNGIHNKDHYSTAHDLALIAKYSLQFSDIMKIAMVKQYTLPVTNKYNKTNRIFNATNALINDDSLNKNYYEYATGLKTGYTDPAGHCIIATAKKDGRELIAVVLHATTSNARYSDCKKLFNYGFNNFTYTILQSSRNVIKNVEISNGTKETKNLDIVVKDEISVLTSKDFDTSNIEPKVEIDDNLKAPISENQVVGHISYVIDGEEYSSDLVAGFSVYPSSFEVILFRALLLFLILYIIFRLLKHNSKPKKRKKSYSKSTKNKHNKSNAHYGRGKYKFTQINDYL